MALTPAHRVAAFVVVGSVAAAVHWCVVVALVAALGVAPLTANVVGWLVAFGVSFGGHRALTFGDARAPWRRAVARFFVVSAAAFAINQAAYALLLRHASLDYRVSLGLVLLAVAALTFWASRRWAFLGTGAG